MGESTVSRRSSIGGPSRIEIPTPTLASTVWDLVGPLVARLIVFYMKLFLILASLAILLVTTILLYSLVYWMAVPKRLHTYPVHFNYESSSEAACANVSLSPRQWEGFNRPIPDWERPTAGFDFDVSIAMEFPSTEHNMRLGPVMFETRALLKSHQEIAKTDRAFLIPQLSWLGRLFRDFVTMALTGLLLYHDKSSADVMLIESLPVFSQESSLSFIHICMHPPVHVYSATLSFVSRLSGLRYFLAHHPFTVGIFVVASVLTLAIAFMIAAYVFRIYKPASIEEDREPVSPVSPREEFIEAQVEEEEGDMSLRNRRNTIRD